MDLFEVKTIDKRFYEEHLKDFLPKRITDIHTHVYLNSLRSKRTNKKWPSLVANENSIEQLVETYKLMFPDKEVTPMIFSSANRNDNLDALNGYIEESAEKYDFPSLIYAAPWQSGSELEEKILKGGFLGCKVYLSLSAEYIPENEIRIFDFLPHHHLEVLNNHGWIAMLHIPRPGRLKDRVNVEQMLEIEQKYPNVKLIIAHVGRAYCNEDVGQSLEILQETENMLFDFSANTNQWVFEELIKRIGPKRILFGSDLPILRMRSRRICEDGLYINLVPKGLYGDVSFDIHMRELIGEEADNLTFMLYEQIDAFRRASRNTGLSKEDIEDVFYNNARRIIDSITR